VPSGMPAIARLVYLNCLSWLFYTFISKLWRCEEVQRSCLDRMIADKFRTGANFRGEDVNVKFSGRRAIPTASPFQQAITTTTTTTTITTTTTTITN